MGEHGKSGVAIPGVPFADLVLVESDFALAGLEAFLDTYLMPATRTTVARLTLVGDQQR